MMRILLATVLLATALTGCEQSADPGDQEFYSDKTITVYIGRPPGSGADLAVRSFVRFWQEHIPGNPTMVVKNVPGGAGSRVWNLAWDEQDPDDLEVFFSPVSATAVIVREPGLRAKLYELPFIGGLSSPNLLFARTENLSDAKDLPNSHGLVFGGQGPAHRFSVLGRLTLDILGVDYTSVTGFSGASDVFNAVRRKEVDIQMAPLNFYKFTVEPNAVEDGEIIPIFYNPVLNLNNEIIDLPAAGDIPNFNEYYESVMGELPSGELYEMYRWLLPNVNGIVHAAVMPKGTSPEAIQILRDSFLEVVEDEEYRAEELKMFGINLPVVGSEQGVKILTDMASPPDNVRRLLDSYIQEAR